MSTDQKELLRKLAAALAAASDVARQLAEQTDEPKPIIVGDPDEELTTEQAAAVLNRTPATLRRWRSEGQGPPVIDRGPKTKRYRRGDLVPA